MNWLFGPTVVLKNRRSDDVDDVDSQGGDLFRLQHELAIAHRKLESMNIFDNVHIDMNVKGFSQEEQNYDVEIHVK
jgi:hypothetical protein